MNNLFIEGAENIPMVNMTADGKIEIKGRAIIENAHDFFLPMIAWAKNYSGELLQMDVNLEYFNTTVSKHLHDMLKAINENQGIEKITMKWHYEDGDDEILESGEIYDDLFERIEFSYHRYAELFE